MVSFCFFLNWSYYDVYGKTTQTHTNTTPETIAAFLTSLTDDETLRSFYKKIRPGGSGWDAVIHKAKAEGVDIHKEKSQLPLELLSWVVGCVTVYGALFATGNWIYGNTSSAMLLTGITVLGGLFLSYALKNLKTDSPAK